MFGDLFNEGDSPDAINGPSVCTQAPSPPKPRSSSKFAGIDNQGATCYMNSLLQTLLLTPEFKEKLFQLSEKDLGSLTDKDKPEAKVRVIPIQLQRLFAQLLLADQQSVSTFDLTNSFGWTNQEGFQQHDVQELNRILFCAIEESLVGTAGGNIINELYRGTFVNQIRCMRCKKTSERDEEFLDLTLAVAGISSVEAALKASYCDVEVMNGRNQYRCETCGILTDATKGAKLRNLPPVLTLSLLRFSFDFVKMSRYKENGRFTFPMQLDMSPYCDKNSGSSDDTYDLFSVVVHRGSAYGGHYFAYIRDIDNLGLWSYQEGKKKQNRRDPSTTGLDVIECESPLDLIENMLSKEAHQAMSIERLCAEITKVTGVSWNKRFKKSYGPINKFLKSNDMFTYNSDSNWVSLASPGSSEPNMESSNSDSLKTQECGTSLAEDSPEASSDKDPEEQNSFTSDRWFCFNDSAVCPILTKEIEQQFSGKESAYMLFYRRRSLKRPDEAQGQLAYSIPERFIQEVNAINDSLLQQRLEYDRIINSTKVKIYEASHFMYRELLHLKPVEGEDPHYKELEFDRRKTVGELRASIREVLEDKDICNFNIHRMKEWCGGFYLCDEISGDESVLQDFNILTDSCLFVWNGSVVDDQFVEEGPDHEPIKLLVLHETDQQPVGEIVLRKSRSLSHLYQAVADMAGLEASVFTIHAGAEMDKTESKQSLSSDSQMSLTEAGLSNDDVLILSGGGENPSCRNSLSPDTSSTREEAEWSITVQEKISGGTETSVCNSLNLNVKPSLGLREFKVKAMEAFGINNDVSAETIRLREVHRTLGLQPPLREGLSMIDSGLSNGMIVVLESGRPPQDSEMTISVNKIVGGKLVSRREFLVDRQLTVLGMLQAACRLLDCEGTQWYLSKTDMYGDPAEPLDNSSVTLLDLLINDGDTLILQEGSIIRKDQVCLNVWLHVDKDPDSTLPGDRGDNPLVNGEKEEDKVILELASKLSVSDHVNPEDLNPLNKCLCPDIQQLFDKSLIVSKSMSIEELKLALMETESFQTLRIPTSNFMRLRLVEGRCLRAVIRNNSQVLRHVSNKEALNIAVQILPCEESLGTQELLLNVAQKIGGSRIYMPAKEFVWNTSGGQGAADLRKVVASKLCLPLHDISIAKYNPDTFVWTVLKDVPQKPVKGKGKKKAGSGKCNIRQAPYYIQDGDLIAVKVISTDKGILEADDFSTQEDIDKRLLLEQIAEEKRRIREEKKNENWMDSIVPNPSKRRPEVPLTIKVDKFS